MSEKLYLGQLFNNFDEFIQTLNEYSKQSYSIWTTVSSRNLEDNNFKYLEIKCIHHREINDITSKSTGLRPKQSYINPCGCLAEIRVNYSMSGTESEKCKLTKCYLQHERINKEVKEKEKAHDLSEEDFIKHPSNRRLSEEEQVEINSNFETGSDAKMIAMYMSNKTNNWLSTRDMWNVRMKFLAIQINKKPDDHPLKQFENVMNKRIEIDNHNNFKLIYDEETGKNLDL